VRWGRVSAALVPLCTSTQSVATPSAPLPCDPCCCRVEVLCCCNASRVRLPHRVLQLSTPPTVFPAGGRATLSVRCSSGLDVVQLIGGAVAYDEGDGDDGDAGLAFIGRVHTATRLSLAMEVSSQLEGSPSRPGHAYVQAALAFTSEIGDSRLRVITARVALTASTEELMGAVRVDAANALIAKQLVLQATRRELQPVARSTSVDLGAISGNLEEAIDLTAAALVSCYGEPREAVTKVTYGSGIRWCWVRSGGEISWCWVISGDISWYWVR
jgi:hypothetical protein